MNLEDKSAWITPNATMSDKSARNEFDLTQEEIIQGIRSKKLQYRENSMHGNPYFKLIRKEVEAFVAKKYGKNHLKKKSISYELKKVVQQINAAKRQLSALEKRKIELSKILGE